MRNKKSPLTASPFNYFKSVTTSSRSYPVFSCCLSGLTIFVLLWLHSASTVSALSASSYSDTDSTGRNQNDESRTLEPGISVEREISGGQINFYEVKVIEGQFLRIVAEQKGSDIVLTLIGLDGKQVIEVDTPDLSTGPETISLVAETSGVYRIRVKTFGETATAGKYEIKIAELREALPDDKIRVAAEKAFAEGEELRLKWTAEALRSSVEKYLLSLDLRRKLNDKRGVGTTLNILGLVNDNLGNKTKAFEYFEQALEMRRAAGDAGGELQTLNNLGVGYSIADDLQKALHYFNQALQLCPAVGDRSVEAFLLTNAGGVYLRLGQVQKAFELFERALPLRQLIGDRRGEAMTLQSIGWVHSYLNERQQALSYYKRALALWQQIGIPREEAATLNDIGSAYSAEGDYRTAFEYYSRVVQMAPLIADPTVKANTLLGVGWILNLTGKYQDSLKFYQQAIQLYQSVDSRSGQAYSLNGISLAYYRMGDYQRAISYLNQTQVIFSEVDDRLGEADTFYGLMFIWQSSQNPRLSILYGKRAVNALQEVRINMQGLDKRMQKSFLNSREDVYRRLADLLITEGRLPEAQQVLDMLKEEEYFEFVRRDGNEGQRLSRRASLTSTEAAIEARYRQIADQVIALGRERNELRSKLSITPEEEKRLMKIEADLDLAGQAFQQFLDKMAREFKTQPQSSDKIFELRESQGLMDTLRELGADSVVLYTIIGADKYRVILITPDVQKAAEYPIKAPELYRKVAAFRQALQDPQSNPRPLAQELYRILVGPIAKDLDDAKAETLMWSLDGVLRYVPMSALHDGKQYLVERFRNVLFTPASRDRLKDEPSAQWKGLGLGVSKPQSGFKALPAVSEELRGIIRDESETSKTTEAVLQGKIMLDEAFTTSTMKAALRQRYSVVHIASHFSFTPGNEVDSFLLIGDGSRLSLAQLKTSTNLFSGVELLTLSACNTATSGTGASGKEVEGFGVLAQRQGAKAVLASLWPVADESTKLLMQNFYRIRNSQKEMLKAEALREAQLILLKGGENKIMRSAMQRKDGADKTGQTVQADPIARYAHPFYWAPFILIGNWK